MYSQLNCTHHAITRASQRNITAAMISATLRFGRKTYQRGALFFSVGKKEIEKHSHKYALLNKMEGIHLVMSQTGEIITVYRDKTFKSIAHC
ncbi:MAG: hypothetical protein WAO12_10360 [Venatoribacter sp.]